MTRRKTKSSTATHFQQKGTGIKLSKAGKTRTGMSGAAKATAGTKRVSRSTVIHQTIQKGTGIKFSKAGKARTGISGGGSGGNKSRHFKRDSKGRFAGG